MNTYFEFTREYRNNKYLYLLMEIVKKKYEEKKIIDIFDGYVGTHIKNIN